MSWRSAIVAAYAALAAVVGIAYGIRGLAVLLFYYAAAGGWTAFLAVWGRTARSAGRWNARRREPPPAPEPDGPGTDDGEPEPVEAAPAARRRRPQPAY